MRKFIALMPLWLIMSVVHAQDDYMWSVWLINNNDDTTVRVYLDGTVETKIFPVPASVWTRKAFSSDGLLMALSRDGNVILHNFMTGKTKEYEVEHTQLGHFSPDGSQLSLLWTEPDPMSTTEPYKIIILSTSDGRIQYVSERVMPIAYAMNNPPRPHLIGFFAPDEVTIRLFPNSDYGYIWQPLNVEQIPYELTPIGLNGRIFDHIPLSDEWVFGMINDDGFQIDYRIGEDDPITIFESPTVDAVHFVDGGQSLVIETQLGWIQLQRDGTIMSLPIDEEVSFMAGVGDGYVYMAEDGDYTSIIYHQMTDDGVQETILWEDEHDYDWQVEWADVMDISDYPAEPFVPSS